MTAPRGSDPIVERFRARSLERLARVESHWIALTQGPSDGARATEMRRDVHTIKGDSRLIGYADVNLLCHKLEELIALGDELGYRVPDEVDLLVTMAVQFTSMLLRKPSGAALGGIDSEGFVRQVDEVLASARTASSRGGGELRSPERPDRAGAATLDHLSAPTRERMAAIVSALFVEHLDAAPPARQRLERLWRTLLAEIRTLEDVPLAPLLDRLLAGAADLAASLGKRVHLTLDVRDARVPTAAVEAIDTAAIHLLRNAIDHGIELPEVRAAAGKRMTGSVHLRAAVEDGAVVLTFLDDGAGLDLAAIRERAVEHSLLEPHEAAHATPEALSALLFCHGFTTRRAASELSGRGIGLDSVRSSLARVGGRITLGAGPGGGTAAVIRIPVPVRHLEVYRFEVAGVPVPFAVSARWQPVEAVAARVLEPARAVGLRGAAPSVDAPRRHLRNGAEVVAIVGATAATPACAHRLCPTADDHPIEVVMVDRVEALLLRPERLR